MKVLYALILALALTSGAPARATEFDSGRLGFAVEFKDEISRYRVLGVYVLPDEQLELEVKSDSSGTFQASADSGRLVRTGPRAWTWSGKRKGLYPVRIRSARTGETMTLNVFVMVPMSQVTDGKLNGYRIGAYPTIRLRGLAIYDPPAGLIELTPENRTAAVSPHFQLGQFMCKQAGGYPKYLVLRERLLLKLETVLAAVNAKGIRCETFAVMSGYRTPFYNKAIGNVKYSRHVWGGAADIYVDANPADGAMDDLNGDGKIDVHDAGVLYTLIDDMYGRPFYERFIGGLGRYRKTSNHPPFVHVDTRGTRARWGH